MFHFCTIGSGNFLPFIETLFASLQQQNKNVILHALITDQGPAPSPRNNLFFYSLEDVDTEGVSQKIIHQFRQDNNHLRWALKPAFLHHLLAEHAQVIYVDNDIHFFSDFRFLFQQLENHSVLLTPHWFCSRPFPHSENFQTNFQIGLFNAGFLGATRKALPFLEWWAEVCLYRMERSPERGFWDDQRYLDMAPVIDENAGIVRHRGCNVGSWNMHENERTTVNGHLLINGKYPIVFIHFNHETIKHILNSNDGRLRPYFDSYEKLFAETGHRLEQYIPFLENEKKETVHQRVMRKAKLRTRIKSWLFQLSQKL